MITVIASIVIGDIARMPSSRKGKVNFSLNEAGRMRKKYVAKAIDAAAIGAENPTIKDIQPERKPIPLPKLSLKNTYSPPALGNMAPNSP